MKTILFLFLALAPALFAQTPGIETDEGTAAEAVTNVRRVRTITLELEKGQSALITFRRERLRLVAGEVVRGHDAGTITRNVETVKTETVQHGGEAVTFQTVLALLRKFHDKWEAEEPPSPK
jgi:hypothetical protein